MLRKMRWPVACTSSPAVRAAQVVASAPRHWRSPQASSGGALCRENRVNALRRAAGRYRPDVADAFARRAGQLFTAEFFAEEVRRDEVRRIVSASSHRFAYPKKAKSSARKASQRRAAASVRPQARHRHGQGRGEGCARAAASRGP